MTGKPHLAAAEVSWAGAGSTARLAAKRWDRRRTSDGVEWPPPDYGSWAAQGNMKKGKEGFSNFETKDSNKIQTQV
jgi:hypothetical protein